MVLVRLSNSISLNNPLIDWRVVVEKYASLQDTLTALESLGFKKLPEYAETDHVFLDSPMSDWAGPVVQISTYQCRNNYYCVDVDSGNWMGPCIWNGPKADWDKSDRFTDFVTFLDKHYPGWR